MLVLETLLVFEMLLVLETLLVFEMLLVLETPLAWVPGGGPVARPGLHGPASLSLRMS
ncbi:hypothetical protein IMZ29_18995 [Achromobacter sp. GG226]|uniref:hypothetical protein n=1 Tax=Verticiella alkaliphila TaxID=2779529 RepID=UPI001C0C1929|nr:hypothetical protein [Verticiella sp. GG226]MBU4612556.1 hypothetical protein [Verticiella sp. GG226]